MKESEKLLPRRTLLKAGASAAFVLAMPSILRAETRKIRFSLPWVATGSSLFPYVSKAKGFWQKRGIDVEISRGYGSIALAQALAARQFDFGLVASPFVVLGVAKNLPLISLGFTGYRSGYAVGLRSESPIRTVRDLVGKRVGAAANAADFPFLPVVLKRAGVDPAQVTFQLLDNKLLEQALITKQVDAISCVVSSSAPLFISEKVETRYLQDSDWKVDTCGTALVTQPDFIARDPQLAQDFTDGFMEGVAEAIANPEESLQIFYKSVPEISLTASGAQFSEIGLAMFDLMILDDVPRQQGLGAEKPERVSAMINLMGEAGMLPAGQKIPSVDQVFDPRFIGRTKLESQQWAVAEKWAAPYQKYFRSEG